MRRHLYKRLLDGRFVLGLALVSLLALSDYGGPSALAAPPEGQRVTVSPTAVSYDDRIEITATGLPPKVTLHAGAVTLGGIRVALPGYFGHSGEKPKSDKLGNLTFTARVPAGVPLGSQALTIDVSYVFVVSTMVDFLGASLSTSPTTAVANETVMISGSGFTPASVKGGLGPDKVHRIDGSRPRVAILNGEMLSSPDLDYPINLDEDGNFFAMLTLPSDMGFTNFLTKWGNYGSADGGFVTPSGVAIDGSWNIYVSEKDGHRVQKFDSSGRFLTKWGSFGSGNGEFNSPVGIAVDKSGNVYVADSGNHRVQKFNSSGKFLTKWGSRGSGNGKFYSPVGTAVDKSGNVYVADSRNHRIQKFNSSGRFLTKWGSLGSGDGEFRRPRDLAVDDSGNIYVLEKDGHRVQKFNSSVKFLTKWGSFGSGNGEFNYPLGTAVDKSGNVYVADSRSHRIQKFDSSMNRGNLELRVTDSGGRTGSVYLAVSAPSVIFDPVSVYPGETVSVKGIGFAASNPAIGAENEVRIDYGVVYNEGKSNQYYFPRLSKEAIVDGSGNFSTQFKVPRQAKIPSSNQVAITPTYGEAIHVIHKVPQPSITVEPKAVFPNQLIDITLAGIGADYKIPPGTVTMGRLPMPIPGYSGYSGPKPKTDQGGRVTFSSTVPKSVPTGLQYLDHRLSGGRLLRSNTVVLTADLKMIPETAAPGQLVIVSSPNLSPADEGAPGPIGNHQISGTGVSTITFGRFTNFLTKWGRLGIVDGGFVTPSGVAIDGSGNIYVSEKDGRRVQKFNSSGKFLTKWGSFGSGNGKFDSPVGTAVDKSGNVYVVDSGNHRIQKFNSSGRFLTKWGSLGSDNGEFDSPEGAAVDKSGNVYVADSGNHRVQKFNSSGRFLTEWGSFGSGNGKFDSPVGTAVDKSGNVYVVDSGNHRIQKFNSSGKFLTKWGRVGAGDGEFLRPRDIAVDDSGNIYVSEKNGHRVQKFNSSGRFLIEWGSLGSDNGKFHSPLGTAVDKSGNVYVADSRNHRIQKFDSSMNLGDLELRVPDSGGRMVPDLGMKKSVYPIDLDNKGRLLLPLVIPVSNVTLAGGPVQMKVTDTGGRTGIGTFNIKRPTLTVSPNTSTRGSVVNVLGDGFVVTSLNDTSRYLIDIEYDRRRVATTYLDPHGTFDVRFKVPSDIKINSENVVTAKVRQLSSEAKAVHRVPSRSMAVSPLSAPRGGKLTITGTGLIPFQVVYIKVADAWVVLSGLYTDVNGAFTHTISLPEGIPLGEQVVKVNTTSMYERFTVTVTRR